MDRPKFEAMSQTENVQSGAPPGVRIAVAAALALLVGGAVVLMLLNGPAILLDLAVSAAAFVCM